MTLLELLIVIAILSLIATIGGLQLMQIFGKSKTRTAELQIEQITVALDLFHIDVGRYPSNEESLQALLIQSADIDGWAGPYVKSAEALDDPWGRRFEYSLNAENQGSFLFSYGRDGKKGGDGEDRDVGRQPQ